MSTKRLLPAVALAAAVSAACGTGAKEAPRVLESAGATSDVRADAAVLADFKTKVEAYVKLRDTLDNHTAPLKKTDDPEAITIAERQLAQNIRAARPDAKRGDFFTSATEQAFTHSLKAAVKGPEGQENRNAISDDNPEKVPFQINGEYPKQQTVSTVPPDVLLSLPALPDNVEYRFVGRRLILYDARANLILDYMLHPVS